MDIFRNTNILKKVFQIIFTFLLQLTYQFSSVTQLCLTFWEPMNCNMTGLPVHRQLLEFTKLISIDSVMPSNHLILCHPILHLPSIVPSVRVFSNESAVCIKWPRYWSFRINTVLPMNIQDWFPLGWTGWNSLQSKEHSRVFSNTTVQKHQFSGAQLSL